MIRRPGRLALVAVLLAAGGLLVASALRGTLTYYRSPTDMLARSDDSRDRIRLGGEVVPGSVRHDGELVTFRLSDDRREVTVRQRGVPPETFREGVDAVVEGRLGTDGVFDADHVLVRHGNEYRPAPAAEPTGAR
ncbi:cytochrome c-type biogenesis protein CcmE [Micromonospora pattaloongensis]|uniref:Cytochrome c-type biogenesis protein CcmE n=1 Tax=Micromonospora pattaloongensis TaxID=405436 RepID=A0A1H3R541_9ACTN|nr:cytochrome c maturation protein CcmE [Micromonospora pattaloongensis]SDZ20633.1 cytochrome c-type biogenesis protein CcmE [Micromonospora pattaloongensis]